MASSGVTETYQYDGDGQRVSRTVGSVTTIYAFGVYEQTGTLQRTYYTFGGQPIALRDSGGSATYLYADHLSSIGATTNSSGTLQSWQRFNPWGSVRAQSTGSVSQTKKSFTGQYRDDTGLSYYNARHYDPVIGCFVSADTISPGKDNPQNRNRYSYTLNNPIFYVDPTGHCVEGYDTTVIYATLFQEHVFHERFPQPILENGALYA